MSIEELNLIQGYDNHEAVGFKLAIAYLMNKNQDFNELRKKLYEEIEQEMNSKR